MARTPRRRCGSKATDFTRSSSAISSAWPSACSAPSTTQRPQRLAELDPGRVAGPVPEPDDRPHLADLLQERDVGLPRLRPAGEEDALGRALAGARRRAPARGARRGTASPARSRGFPGRARTRARGTPPRRPSQKRRRERRMYQLETSSTNASKLSISRWVQLILEGLGRLADVLLRAGDEPAVERARALVERRRVEVGEARGEALDVPVVDEEPHRVPEREELLLDLLRRARSRRGGSDRAAARRTASASRRRPCARTHPRRRSCSPTSRASRCPRSSSIFS